MKNNISISMLLTTLFLVGMILFLSGCAPSTGVHVENADVYGFFGGLWHGFIILFDFIGMIIFDDVTLYAPANTGLGYAFGFILGAVFFYNAFND